MSEAFTDCKEPAFLHRFQKTTHQTITDTLRIYEKWLKLKYVYDIYSFSDLSELKFWYVRSGFIFFILSKEMEPVRILGPCLQFREEIIGTVGYQAILDGSFSRFRTLPKLIYSRISHWKKGAVKR